MRTVELKIYTFNELREESKEVAKEEMQLFDEYLLETDMFKSLKEFFRRLDIEISYYDIDWNNPKVSSILYKTPKDNISDFTFNLKKDYLTGLWVDNVIMKTWNKTKSIDDTIYDFLLMCKFDFNYQKGNEYASEHAFDNDYEFLEDGSFYKRIN